jgi:hypothetical protein
MDRHAIDSDTETCVHSRLEEGAEMGGRGDLRWRATAYVLMGTIAVGAPVAAWAQSCPPGYYYASDGNCYPGPPPTYAPPAYDAAPPVAPPPVVTDGFLLGLGILIGGLAASSHDHEYQGREQYRPPERRGPPQEYHPSPYEHH